MRAAASRPGGRRWAIFAVMALASLPAYFHQVGLATVSGDVAFSLGCDAVALGLLGAAFSYTYAAMQVPVGLLVDFLGARRGVTIFLLIAAAGTALFAQAAGLGMAVAARVLLGVGFAMVAVPFMKLIAIWFPAKDFGRVTALSYTLGGTGFWLATSPMAAASAAMGWRASFMVLGAFTLTCAILVWVVVRDAPAESCAGAPASTPVGAARPGVGRVLRRVVGNRQAWCLALWFTCQTGFYFSFVGLWGGQYAMRVLEMPATHAGWILSLAACAIMAAPCFTWLLTRVGSRRRLFLLLSACSFVLSLPLVIGIEAWHPAATGALFLLLALCGIGASAELFSAAVALFPVAWAGTVTGFMNIFPFLGGALLQQAMGGVIETLGARGLEPAQAFSLAFALYTATAAAGAVGAFLYREEGDTVISAR